MDRGEECDYTVRKTGKCILPPNEKCNTVLLVSTISLKLPTMLAKRLDAEARKSGRSKSQVVREALEKSFDDTKKRPATFYDLAPHLAGCASGPRDLSTKKKHLSDFGR